MASVADLGGALLSGLSELGEVSLDAVFGSPAQETTDNTSGVTKKKAKGRNVRARKSGGTPARTTQAAADELSGDHENLLVIEGAVLDNGEELIDVPGIDGPVLDREEVNFGAVGVEIIPADDPIEFREQLHDHFPDSAAEAHESDGMDLDEDNVENVGKGQGVSDQLLQEEAATEAHGASGPPEIQAILGHEGSYVSRSILRISIGDSLTRTIGKCEILDSVQGR